MKLKFSGILSFFVIIVWAQTPYSTGLIMDDKAYDNTPLKARNVGFQDVVADITSVSLKEFVPEIKNQGYYGTCVGWSTAYYGRSILESRMNNSKSDSKLFSPLFTYMQSNVDDDYNCQGGAYINRALKSMVEDGSAFFSDFDDSCGDEISTSVVEKAKEYRIKDFTRLYGASESKEVKIESVKRSLANGNPVIIGFLVENAFYYAKNLYEPEEMGVGGHAMCVVGYDDDKYGGAFEIVNSWGTDWGNSGYIWVRYDDFVNYTRYAFEMIPQTKVEKRNLAGKLKMMLQDGSEMTVTKGNGGYGKSVLGWQEVVVDKEIQSAGDYQTQKTFPEGTRYRMYVEVEKPSYVYVFAADSNGQNGILFPHDKNISPFINYDNTEVIIPGEKHWFRLGGQVNSDYSIVLFSEHRIEVEEVKNQLDTLDGDLLDKLYLIFKDKLIAKENIKLSEGEIAFEATYSSGSMVLMLLEIKRN